MGGWIIGSNNTFVIRHAVGIRTKWVILNGFGAEANEGRERT